MSTQRTRIGLEDALRLSTKFSAYAAGREVPSALEVPVPTEKYCQFLPKPWGELDPPEREAFQRFYEEVGNDLEDLARDASAGGDIDTSLDGLAWNDITRVLQQRR